MASLFYHFLACFVGGGVLFSTFSFFLVFLIVDLFIWVTCAVCGIFQALKEGGV